MYFLRFCEVTVCPRAEVFLDVTVTLKNGFCLVVPDENVSNSVILLLLTINKQKPIHLELVFERFPSKNCFGAQTRVKVAKTAKIFD